MAENKCSLMRSIQMADFALVESGLFLDSHPDCKNAREYYRHFKEIRDDAAKDYVKLYGPIEQMDYDGGDWKWTDQPFPWLNEANR